jgi:hypothetical protein
MQGQIVSGKGVFHSSDQGPVNEKPERAAAQKHWPGRNRSV